MNVCVKHFVFKKKSNGYTCKGNNFSIETVALFLLGSGRYIHIYFLLVASLEEKNLLERSSSRFSVILLDR